MSETYTIYMSGGPQDGMRHTLDYKPMLVGVAGGSYADTGTTTEDGALILEYRSDEDTPPLSAKEEAEVDEIVRRMYEDPTDS